MKRIISLTILFALLLLLVSCGDSKYPPVESSELENKTVATIKIDGESYKVKYELYRALFLTLRESVDGGDKSVWSSDNKTEYEEKIDGLIFDRISDIYATLHLCKKLGIDLYSSEVESDIETSIKISIEGGSLGDYDVEGYDGDYERYLAALKEKYINYSVQVLLLRYSIGAELLNEYYVGNIDAEFIPDAEKGHLEYSREDVKSFYDSDECVLVLRAFLNMNYFSKDRAAQIRDTIASKNGAEDVGNYIISISTTSAQDIKSGEIIGKHNLDKSYYAELTEEAFSIPTFGTSRVIEVKTGYEDGYVIIYKTVKSDVHFDANYEKISGVYVMNEIGKILDGQAAEIYSATEKTDFLSELDRSSITMDQN